MEPDLGFPVYRGAGPPGGLTAAFTGYQGRHLGALDATRIFLALNHLAAFGTYVTGACRGVDAFVGQSLYMLRPLARHVVVVPADRSRVDVWWVDATGVPLPGVEVIEMPEGTTYRDRNHELLVDADVLFGWPTWPENDPRSARSGSWQTIRLAKSLSKSVFVKTLRES